MPLRDLGFSPPQEWVYRALIANPTADVAGLRQSTGLAEEDIVNALDGLARLEVVRIAPSGISVPDPVAALGRLIEQVEEETLARYRRVSDTRTEVASLQAGFTQAPAGREEPVVERVDGLEAVRERIAELSFFSQVSVDAIQPGGAQSAAALQASRPLDLRAVRRKLGMRVIHETPVLDDELNRAYLRELVMLGVRARVADAPLGRMLILDHQVAVVPADPHDSSKGALIVRHAGLVAGLQDLFDRTWASARELPWVSGEEDPPEDLTITESDQRVLGMLASGCTDETAAREMGVSVRHLRRRIARLMLLLGAHSRFEAGVEAARRGLL